MSKEQEILKRLSAGDEGVFKDIFEHYYNDLCTYVYVKLIRDKEEAEEIVQNIFVKLWEKRNELPEIDSLKSYLYKSAYHASINYFEHQAVIRKYKHETEYRLKKLELTEPVNPFNEEKINEVIKMISKLPEQTKRVFTLKYLEGKKYKEIARELNISDKTVQTLIYRGLKQLRNKLTIILLCIYMNYNFLYHLITKQ